MKITPLRILGLIAGALVVTLVVLVKVQSDYILLVPDVAHPVAPLVRVADPHPAKDGGELFFVDVQEQRASEFDLLFQSEIYPHSTRLPVEALIPPGTSQKRYNQAGRQEMVTSQKIAGIVAERQLGLPVVADPNGVLVDNVYGGIPATSKIDPADVIVAANGTPTLTPPALRAAVGKVKPGDIVHLTIRRGAVTLHEDVKTVADPQDKTRPLIGVQVEQSARIRKLPVKVSIDAGNIGGPSAGLAFTLEVMQLLGANVTHGYKVAATGEMSIDGKVGAIGGVEQKTWGAREAGAQVFLVPVDGGNAKEAKKYAGPDLIIIPVTSIGQALHALAALPKLK
jgi:PDZ domain-containing protein